MTLSFHKDQQNKIRKYLKAQGFWAFWVTGTDPHGSEYVPNTWDYRWGLTGFTGSAGAVLVTEQEVGLWTDSRYHLQAPEEIRDQGVVLYPEGMEDTPTIPQWILHKAPPGAIIAIDGMRINLKDYMEGKKILEGKGLVLSLGDNPFSPEDYPPLPSQKIWNFEEVFSSLQRKDKLAFLTRNIQDQGKEATLLSRLDEIAWLLGLRGSDIPYNPFFFAFFYWDINQRGILYCQEKSIDPHLVALLKKENIEVKDYHQFALLGSQEQYLQDWASTPAGLWKKALPTQGKSWCSQQKVCKNPQEILGMKEAQHRDSLAMIEFLAWLENQEGLKEREVQKQLLYFRERDPHFISESFQSIVAFGPHGAIVHYSAKESSEIPLPNHTFLLIDSGAHYHMGTTDVTRTLVRGEIGKEEKQAFTTVLKAHIALSTAIFPEGTQGYQLDALARDPLWRRGLNYGHGTGHGVGHVLGVHESPPRLSPHPESGLIREGMILSNEPGYYKPGHWGIRLENLVLVVSREKGWLAFESLTRIPFDPKGVSQELLTDEEKLWLKSYHLDIWDTFSPLVAPATKNWLEKTTDNWLQLLNS